MPIAPPSPDRSRPGSPNGLDDSRRVDTGAGGGRSGFGRNGSSQDSEEVGVHNGNGLVPPLFNVQLLVL